MADTPEERSRKRQLEAKRRKDAKIAADREYEKFYMDFLERIDRKDNENFNNYMQRRKQEAIEEGKKTEEKERQAAVDRARYERERDAFNAQTKASKLQASANKNLEKITQSREKSLSSIVGSLIQGNFQEIQSVNLGKKALQSELLLAQAVKTTQDGLEEKFEKEQVSLKSQGEVRDLVKGIQDGIFGQTDAQALLNKLTQEGISNTGDLADVLRTLGAQADLNAEAQSRAQQKQDEFTAAVGTATIAFAALGTMVAKISEVIDTIGQSFGSLVVFSAEFKKNISDAGTDAISLGGNLQDTINIAQSLSSEFGLSLDEAVNLSSKVFDTSKALGLSAEEGANLFGVLMQTANLSAEQAEHLAESTFQLAAQAGVAPNAVMKDIAASTESVANFTKDGGDNIARAAIQARALGVSLDTTAKIAEGLLDFESSIRAEQEASVLIGRQINLQKAREAALSNDIEGAMKAVVSELGSEEEFNRLNLLQRQSLAKSIGVSTAELAKFVGKQEEVNSLSNELSKGESFSDLLGRDSISQITQFLNGFKALTAEILNSLGPSLEVIGGLFSGIAGFLRENVVAMKILGVAAGGVAIALGVVAIKAAAAAVAGIPFLGPALAVSAIAAIAAAINSGIGKVNDFQTGPGGIQYMTGPAGTFELNPRDSVLATTNPIPVQKVNEYPSEGSLKPLTSTTINNTQPSIESKPMVVDRTPPEIQVNVKGVTRGKDIHYVTNNRPISGGDAGFGGLA